LFTVFVVALGVVHSSDDELGFVGEGGEAEIVEVEDDRAVSVLGG